MKRNVRLMVLTILVLFVMPLVVNADPLERFAENPIPYWDDDSINVGITWSEAEQTVEFGQVWWEEDFISIDDWVEQEFEGADSFTTDGDIMTFVSEYDVGGVYDRVYTNDISVSVGSGDLRIRFDVELNETSYTYIENLYVHLYDEESRYGNKAVLGISKNIASQVIDVPFTDFVGWESLTDIDCVEIQLRARPDKAFEWQSGYFIIGPLIATLDVGVPLEPEITQSVEFMGNFSALNSTIRFQMYDNVTPSGLWCEVNSTQVTFPGAGDNGLSYALFSDVARINFSLDEERIIFEIYVSAQNMTLINCYSTYVGLANNDYLRMNDSVFEGSYELWYLQGDLGYLAEVINTDNIFYLLFLSLEMWGYLGPFALVFIGYVLTRKDKFLGVLWFVVECLFVVQYLALVEATPDYWWHIFILLLGGLFTCVYPLLDR